MERGKAHEEELRFVPVDVEFEPVRPSVQAHFIVARGLFDFFADRIRTPK